MKLQNVTSSVLKAVGYDNKTKTVQTELLNNSLYEYYGVPKSEFENFMNAPSLGEYYNKFIKKHDYSKLR
jgi:hypothetical protein